MVIAIRNASLGCIAARSIAKSPGRPVPAVRSGRGIWKEPSGFPGGADTVIMMSIGVYFAIGAAALVMLSAVVGLLIAATLGSLSRSVSVLLEAESCSLMLLTRARATRQIEAAGSRPADDHRFHPSV